MPYADHPLWRRLPSRVRQRLRRAHRLHRALLCTVRGVAAGQGRRHRPRTRSVRAFCLFVGYPRSGHSLVGALLNAHPEALVAHETDILRHVLAGYDREAIFGALFDRDAWFEARDRRWEGYDYRVDGLPDGEGPLAVIGDKKGAETSLILRRFPHLLDALRDRVGLPLRVLHHVRNPFDNVATIWRRRDASPLDASIDYYLRLCDGAGIAEAALRPGELLRTRHEDLISAPEAELARICAFVGLEPTPSWLDRCAARVVRAPHRSRHRIAWPPAMRERVDGAIARYPWLAGYRFDDDGGPGAP